VAHAFEIGADPILMARELGEAVYYVHAKDVYVDPEYVGRYGYLDGLGSYSWLHDGHAGFGKATAGGPYGEVSTRASVIRSVGYGHDLFWWKRFVSELRMAGYDYVLSIEQNDPLASVLEGVSKSIAALRECVLQEPGLGAVNG
jgi:sugar phosphate isomerase/epimerase